MNWFGLFASIIDSLAWPTLVGIVIFLLRDSFNQLLQRLSRFKYKDVEANFNERLNDLQPTESIATETERLVPDGDNTVTLLELADISPRGAILEAWIKIESSTRGFLESVGMERRKYYQGLRRLSPEHLSKIEQVIHPYEELRILRNEAAHSSDFDLTPETARRYIETATWVEQTIKEATRQGATLHE